MRCSRGSLRASDAADLCWRPMRVYVCRHAHALPGEPDAERELSDQGRVQAASLAALLAALEHPPLLVLTSPLQRALQTAAIVGEAAGIPVRIDEGLAPGATADGMRRAIADVTGPVATVGHQPDCSEIVRALTGRDPGFPPGGMAEVELTA